jgi:hypothetical protein
MLADIVSASPLTVQILAIVAAGVFALAALAEVMTPIARLVRFLVPEDKPGHPLLLAVGLCVVAVAILFLT